MPAPTNYHGLPPVDPASKGNFNTGSEQDIYHAADLIRPRGAGLEQKVASMARVAVRIIDRQTGKAMELDEITPAYIGAETPAGAAAQIIADKPGRGLKVSSVAFTGDSITAIGTVTDVFEVIYPPHSLAWTERLIPNIPDPISGLNNFAVSGITSAIWLATYIPRVTALASKPSHCSINIGTNDAQTFVPVANYMANIRGGVATLRAAGIEPIIMSVTPSPTASGTYGLSARYNRELAAYCAEERILFVDTRELASSTIEGLEVSGSLSDPGVTGGLHPKAMMEWQFAAALGRTLADNADPDLPTIWSEGEPINGIPYWANTTGIGNFPGANTTGTASLIARADGIAGNILRLTIANNGTKSIGSGDTGVAFAAAAGVSQNDYDVFFRRDLNFSNGGSPFISVKTEKFTGRKIIMVWLETVSFAVQTLVQDVIDDLNAHPEVSAILTAASTGTPGSNVSAFGSTYANQNIRTATPGADETGLVSGRQVRGLMEIWNPAGAQYAGMQLINATGTGANGVRAQCRINNADFSSIPLPTGKIIVHTPWFTVTDHRRFYVSAFLGGANGVYDLGRTWVQMRNL